VQDIDRRSLIIGLVAVAAGAAFALWAGQVCALHCDETNVIRHAARFGRGDFHAPGRPGLLWLLLAPLSWIQDPVAVTRAMRLAAGLASVATLLGVLQLAGAGGDVDERSRPDRRWAGPLAVLLLATSLDWQGHAFEVRTDTFVVPLTLLAMLQLWRAEPSLKRAALAGALIAATGLFSQKSVYNAGAIALGWGVWVLATGRPFRLVDRLKQGAVVTAVVAALGGGWFGLLALVSEQGGRTVGHTFEVATRTGFGFGDIGMDQKLEQLAIAFERAPVVWVLFALSVPWAIVMVRKRPRAAAVTATALAMLATIYVHRGFRTYYVASLEPYMVLSGGALLGWACALLARKAPVAAPIALAVLVVGVAGWRAQPHVGPLLATDNAHQLRLMRDVDDLFEERVPYMDLLGLVSGYEEVTFLGTGHTRTLFRRRAGLRAEAELGEGATSLERGEVRRRAEQRAFIDNARRRKPRFFVHDYMSRERYLKKPERRWIWTHYLPIRPNLYLHGGRMLLDASGAPTEQRVELLLDDAYTVHFRGGWSGEARVDGAAVRPGQVLELAAGEHLLSGRLERGEGELWLLLGRDRTTDFETVAEQVDWSMFPRDRRDRFQQYDNRKRSSRKPADLRTPDHDPSLTERSRPKRAKRHRRYQQEHQERYAQP
jgi:hypothetical protein